MSTKANTAKGKILLVDDDPGLLRLLSIRLRAEQYEVEAVDCAAGAETLQVWVTDGGRLTPHLQRAGFQRREEGPRVVAYAPSRGGAGGSRDGAWRWDMTHSDVMA